jgi:hypothetical protein
VPPGKAYVTVMQGDLGTSFESVVGPGCVSSSCFALLVAIIREDATRPLVERRVARPASRETGGTAM